MKNKLIVLLLAVLSLSMFAQVKNSDKPMKGKWDLQMKMIWEAEEAGKDLIGEIQAICTAKDGRVYMADAKICKTFIFNKVGKYISTFAEKGEGPGEIKNYGGGGALFVVNNSLVFAERGRIHYFDLDGKFKHFVNVPAHIGPQRFITEDSFISAPASIETNDVKGKKSKILLYNLKDKSRKVISEYNPFSGALASDGGAQVVRIVIPDITPLMFLNYGNGKIYYGMSDVYKINFVNIDGKGAGSFTIQQRKRKPVTKEYKKDLGVGFGDIKPALLKQILDSLPDKASFFQALLIDKDGMVWVFASDPSFPHKKAIDMFSPDGKYLYSSELKVEEGVILDVVHLDGDYVYISVIDDNEGVSMVVKYSIRRPVL